MRSEAETVPAYLRGLPADRRSALSALRALIRDVAPDARESMKYGHPHYDLDGPLFALGSQKHHMALYVAERDVMDRWKKRLGARTGVDAAPSCIRFRKLERLDLDEVRALLAEARAARRG